MRLLEVPSRENEGSENHVAKQNCEKPCAVMPARTDLWELWASNRPEPPDRWWRGFGIFGGNFRGFRAEKWRIGGNFSENAGLPLRKQI